MSHPAGREAFQRQFDVSRETMAKLDRYAELLAEWNQKFNLVADSTLPQIWTRHFLDSAQILKYLPNTEVCIADLGSGAGFPGLVLAIMGAKNVHLVESTGKKANFLREVIKELGLSAEVHNERVESLAGLKPDIVTARALGSLLDLLNLAQKLINPENCCIFLKGQRADVELTESAKYLTFSHEKHRSLSDPSGSVLVLKDVKRKNALFRKRKPKRR